MSKWGFIKERTNLSRGRFEMRVSWFVPLCLFLEEKLKKNQLFLIFHEFCRYYTKWWQNGDKTFWWTWGIVRKKIKTCWAESSRAILGKVMFEGPYLFTHKYFYNNLKSDIEVNSMGKWKVLHVLSRPILEINKENSLVIYLWSLS